jgi:hypothetical protein
VQEHDRPLLYLIVTQPDIQFVMGLCARFHASPRYSHWTAVQRIFRYLKHTPKFGIWYFASSSLDLVGFFDADLAGCWIERKSTSETCHFLDLHLFAGLLKSSLLLHSPPPRPNM